MGNKDKEIPSETVNDAFLRWDEGVLGTEGASVEFKTSVVVSARISAVIKHLREKTPAAEQNEEFHKKIRRLQKLSPQVQAWILARAIAGMANNAGGILYLGVTDSGFVSGLEGTFDALREKIGARKGLKRLDIFQRLLRRRIERMFRDRIFAGTLYEFEFRKTGGRKLEYCAIRIRPSPIPIYICDEPKLREGPIPESEKDSYENLFVRIGNSTELCPANERERFIAARFGKVSLFRKFRLRLFSFVARIFSPRKVKT